MACCCRDNDRNDILLSNIINFLLRVDCKEVAHCLVNFLSALMQNKAQIIELSDGRVYRGGGLPHKHSGFFQPGKKYRVPGFLSTSFKANVAIQFMAKADQLRQEHCVLWVIHVNPGCKHANFIGKPHINTEEEYLFAPYSPFQVKAVS
jgi:hypothetical protein